MKLIGNKHIFNIRNLSDRLLHNNLRTFLILTSFLMAFIFLLVTSYITYYIAVDAILNRMEMIDNSELKQVNNKITLAMKEIEKLTRNLSKNETLLNYLRNYNSYTLYDIENRLKSIVYEIALGYDNIVSIGLYTDKSRLSIDKEYYSLTFEKARTSNVYTKIKMSGENLYILEPSYRDQVFNKGFGGITFASIITDGNVDVGLLLVRVKHGWIENIFGSKNNIIIGSKDSASAIIASNNEGYDLYGAFLRSAVGEQGSSITKVKNKGYKFYYIKSEYKDWITLVYRSVRETAGPIGNLRKYVLISILASILLSFLLSRIVSGSVIKPIAKLINMAKNYNAGNKVKKVKTTMKKLSFRDYLMLYFLGIVIFPVVVYCWIFYFTSSTLIKEKVEEGILKTLSQTADNIDSFVEINERIVVNIIIDSVVQTYLKESLENHEPSPSLREKVGAILEENLALGQDVSEICLFSRDRKLLFSTTTHQAADMLSPEAFERLGKSRESIMWTYNDKDIFKRDRVKLLWKIKGIKSKKYELVLLGYIVDAYYERRIADLYSDINLDDSAVYIVDDSGTIVSHKNKALIGKKIEYYDGMFFKRSGKTVKDTKINALKVFKAECSAIPWTVVGEIPVKVVQKDNDRFLASIAFLIVIETIAIILFAYLLSFIFSKSLNRLSEKLLQLGDGNMNPDFSDKIYINEIDELTVTFVSMTARINELIEKVYNAQLKEKALENEKKDAELAALQAQVNPHFLYNTLDTVNWMIRKGEKSNASKIITALGDLFRYGIGYGGYLISIEKEIEYTKAYVEIQKLRYKNRINFNWHIDENLLHYMTQKLILQPLVENSIYHGIGDGKSKGNITISCTDEGDTIALCVTDDGKGMERFELDRIQNALKGRLIGKNIGICNVQKRLQLFFSSNCGLDIISQPSLGTIVTIRIPKIIISNKDVQSGMEENNKGDNLNV